jgi:GNAT superfamily N-acetyltransferase
MPAVSEEESRRLFDDYSRSRDVSREYLAFVDGRPVGAAFAVAGRAAVNLFGGGVLEEARGRGVYRALVSARWDEAVERGTPVLTVQAGRHSRPILERLGFEPLLQARMFVDTLT